MTKPRSARFGGSVELRRNPVLPPDATTPGRLCRATVVLAALVAASILHSSCTTVGGRASAGSFPGNTKATATTSSWVMVSSKPPTWYPRGTPADHPTDFRNGEWVFTGDSLDTRYFIPLRGIAKERHEALRREALAARNPRMVNRIAGSELMRAVGVGAATIAVMNPVGFLSLAANQGVDIKGSPGGFGMGSFSPGSISPSCTPSMSGGCTPAR